jgi:hypothetical protein
MSPATATIPSDIARELPGEKEPETPTAYNWARQVRNKNPKAKEMVSINRPQVEKRRRARKTATKK